MVSNQRSRVLVVGGSGAIGSATVRAFCSAGHSVVIADLVEPAEDLRVRQDVGFIPTNVLAAGGIENLARVLDDRHGVAHVISVVGGAEDDEFSPLGDMDVSVFERSIALNLTSHVRLVRSLLPLLRSEHGDASVAFVSSINALRDYGLPAYSAAKAGLVGLVVALTTELGERGVRVNALMSGTVRTPRTAGQPKDFEALSEATALGRLTSPDEVGAALLALSRLTAVTGQTLVVDSGQTMVTRDWRQDWTPGKDRGSSSTTVELPRDSETHAEQSTEPSQRFGAVPVSKDLVDGREDRMKPSVFLSWSGNKSHNVAQELMYHLKALFPSVEMVISDNLGSGKEWASSLMRQIDAADLAILCLTRLNVEAPWVNFELGAFYRVEGDRPSIPYLLDLTREELKFPSGMFQAEEADRRGTRKVFREVGRLAGCAEDEVDTLFTNKVWTQLRSALDDIRKVEEDGSWRRTANAFFLGHDLRWTLGELVAAMEDPSRVRPRSERTLYELVSYGLVQSLHHARQLGAGSTDHALLLGDLLSEVMESDPSQWPESHADLRRIKDEIQRSFDGFKQVVKDRQPDYVDSPDDNAEMRRWVVRHRKT